MNIFGLIALTDNARTTLISILVIAIFAMMTSIAVTVISLKRDASTVTILDACTATNIHCFSEDEFLKAVHSVINYGSYYYSTRSHVRGKRDDGPFCSINDGYSINLMVDYAKRIGREDIVDRLCETYRNITGDDLLCLED